MAGMVDPHVFMQASGEGRMKKPNLTHPAVT